MADPVAPQAGWQWYAVGSAVFAAATAILGKFGVENVPTGFATLVRTGVVLALTLGVVTYRQEWPKADTLTGKGVLFLVLSGLAGGLSWLAYYQALKMAPASMVAPVDKLSVALVIPLAAIFLGEPLTWRTVLGGLLVTGGAVLVAWK